MTSEEMIAAVINTLNNIEVHGEANLDKMLGGIQTLKQVLQPETGENDG